MRKNINICAVKKCDSIIGAPAKKCQRGGGGARTKIPTTYGENDLYVERKDCPHRKNTPPPHGIFLFMPPPPPGKCLLFSPRRAPTMISTHFIPFV